VVLQNVILDFRYVTERARTYALLSNCASIGPSKNTMILVIRSWFALSTVTRNDIETSARKPIGRDLFKNG
jgi:hypothetical protein